MKDYLELFGKTMQDFASCKDTQNQLLDLTEHLFKSLEQERASTTMLQEKIRELSKQDVFGITSKFEALKADYAVLKNKLAFLNNENDDLNIQLISKNEEIKQIALEKEEHYIRQLRLRDEEISRKESEIQRQRDELNRKEHQLYNTMQASEASIALQIDKIEDDFRKKMAESNRRLQESMETCNALRVELMTIKQQFIEYKRNSNEKIGELQRRIRDSEETTPLVPIEEISMNNEQDKNMKFQALDVSCVSWSTAETIKPKINRKVPVYRAINKFTKNAKVNEIPPLIQLQQTGTNANVKRRKLYTPDDLSALTIQEELNN